MTALRCRHYLDFEALLHGITVHCLKLALHLHVAVIQEQNIVNVPANMKPWVAVF